MCDGARSACGTRAAWSGETCSGERVSYGNGATTVAVRAAHGGLSRVFDLGYRYELGTVNSGNEFDRARSRARKGGSHDVIRVREVALSPRWRRGFRMRFARGRSVAAAGGLVGVHS